MRDRNWVREFPAAITVCDSKGVILGMNDMACATFAHDGGADLVGTNILACHPEPARTTVAAMLASGLRNVYTIEKRGMKKLIFQSPWYQDGQYAGFVELSLPIPGQIPHFVRDSQPDL
jgi:hypothetical protein